VCDPEVVCCLCFSLATLVASINPYVVVAALKLSGSEDLVEPDGCVGSEYPMLGIFVDLH
jgi:hypothetical protein